MIGFDDFGFGLGRGLDWTPVKLGEGSRTCSHTVEPLGNH